MIIRKHSGRLRFATQADHARLAADLLALVRRPELVDHPRRKELLRAVADHDNGWWELDAAPRVSAATGVPLDFRTLPAEERSELWRRGVDRFAAEAPYRAALVAGHASRLHHGAAEPPLGELLIWLDARRAELRDACGVSESELTADDRGLALADALSLSFALGDASPLGVFDDLRAVVEDAGETTVLRLAPFPFAGETRFALRGRSLPDGFRGGDRELAGQLAAASWERFDLRVEPLA